MLTFGLVFDMVLFGLGLVWCREMFGRWRTDLSEYRQAERPHDKAAILIWWVVTVVVVVLMINFVVSIWDRISSW